MIKEFGLEERKVVKRKKSGKRLQKNNLEIGRNIEIGIEIDS